MAQAQAAAPSGPPRPDQTGGGNPGAGPAPAPGGTGLLTELKVSGHMMTLDTGLYCILHKPAPSSAAAGGLPGIRVSLPPGETDGVEVTSFRADGWLSPLGDAALVRVSDGPARLLVTIYQAMNANERTAPSVQVMKLIEGAPAAPRAVAEVPAGEPAARAVAAPRGPAVMEMIAHIQERGDVGAMFGEWLGERGSKRWIEGFGLSPTHEIMSRDIEYQAVLGQGWLSPWVEGGQFCGSRAMALPLLGLRVRLRGEALRTHDVIYAASFIDGTSVGPVSNGEACEADSLAAMEAFQVSVRRRDEEAAAPRPRGKSAPEPARGKPAGRKR